jgi:GTP pyrophosphokinase
VVRQLIELHGGEEGASEDLTEVSATRLVGTPARAPIDDTSVVVEGLSDVQTKLARCCMPVPGDEILGLVTRGEGVSVHRTDCTNADDLRAKDERIIDVSWGQTGHGVFMVRIQVEALDREGLLSDVTKALTDQRVNIVSGSIFTRRDRVAFSRFTFEMSDVRHLDTVLSAVREVEGVYEASRA